MRNTRLCLLPIALCFLHGAAWPQGVPGSFPPDRYLAPLIAAERATSGLIPAAGSTPETAEAMGKRRSAFENLAILRSFSGDTDGAIAAFDKRDNGMGDSNNMQTMPEDVQAEDAIDAIVEQARSKRVVLINEAHHVPMHRAFTQKLAARLRKIGYTYLACEGFSWTVGEPFPAPGTMHSGAYMREPVFAGFVNAALADGWQLVPYESKVRPQPGETARQRSDTREQTQARNLVERIFDKDKNAKVLIHVGYGHLDRSTPETQEMPIMMGEYLRRMTGLDMLHIDQIRFYAHPDRARETPMYASLVGKFPLKEPFVLRKADGSHPVLLGQAGRVDMQVIFPRYANHDGRPDWLGTLAGRTARPIPAELLPTQGRRLIKAFRPGAKPDTVAADIVLVEAGKPAPALMLPPGEFLYVHEDEGI